jgi:hypothetical protein
MKQVFNHVFPAWKGTLNIWLKLFLEHGSPTAGKGIFEPICYKSGAGNGSKRTTSMAQKKRVT